MLDRRWLIRPTARRLVRLVALAVLVAWLGLTAGGCKFLGGAGTRPGGSWFYEEEPKPPQTPAEWMAQPRPDYW